MLERGYQMSSVLENSTASQHSVCPAGSRVLPDFKEENLPVFEMNILLLLLLVSCFLILHYMHSLIYIKKETRRVHTCCQKSARRGFLAKIFKAAWKDFLLTSVLEIYSLLHEDNEEATHQHQHFNFHFLFKLRNLRPRASFLSGYFVWWLWLYVRVRERPKSPVHNPVYNRELQIVAVPKAA